MLKSFLLLIICLCFYANTEAQIEDIRHTITPSVGASTMKFRIKTSLEFVEFVSGSQVSYQTNVQTTPVYSISYAYHVSQKFSIGALLATQKAYGDIWKEGFPETASFTRRRNFLSVLPNFYYLRDERFDLYSGLRLGLVHSSTKVTTSQSQANELVDVVFSKLLGGVRPTLGLSILNARVRLSPNIALQAEFNLGAPNYGVIGMAASF